MDTRGRGYLQLAAGVDSRAWLCVFRPMGSILNSWGQHARLSDYSRLVWTTLCPVDCGRDRRPARFDAPLYLAVCLVLAVSRFSGGAALAACVDLVVAC